MPGRRIFTRIALWSLASIALLAVTLALAWRQGRIQPWLQAKVVQFYVQKVEPGLPFKIEKAEVDASWADFRRGKLTRLSLILKWDPWRIRLSGPIQIDRKEASFSVEYATTATLEPARSSLKTGDVTTPFRLSLAAHVARNLRDVEELAVYLQADQFKWPLKGLEGEKIYMSAGWQENEGQLELHATQAGWSSPSAPDRALSLQKIRLTASSALQFKPFRAGPLARFDFRARGAELLDGETYLDLPLSILPVRGELSLGQTSLDAARLWIGPREEAEVRLGLGKRLQVDWKTKALALRPLIDGVLQATQSSGGALTKLTSLHDLRVRSGALSTQGTFAGGKARGELTISKADVDLPEPKVALRGLNLKLPFDPDAGSSGVLEIDRVLYRKLEARLDSTQLALKPLDESRYSITIGKSGRFPLSIHDVPLKIATLSGTLSRDGKSLVTTDLALEPTRLSALAESLCIDSRRIPPSTLRANFPKIEITESSIIPEGLARIDLLDGAIEISEIGAFDYTTRAPEFHFDLEMGGVKLSRLGEWLNFGEMDGTLDVYARDVVLQGLLPTQFDFRLEARPLNSKKVVFSGQAMKNLIRVLANDSYDDIPHIAKVFAFMGSYNLDFAGISAFSHNGSILIETLTPREIYEKERKYYIFYGWRAKMPLMASRHPVVVDAPAMASLVRYMSKRLEDISDEEARKSGKPPKSKERDYEDLDPLCDPTRR